MPRASPTKKSSQAPSSESDAQRPTANISNIRQSLAKHGHHYHDKTKLQQYRGFFEEVGGHLYGDRMSAMKAVSAQKYIDFTDENATTAEKSFFRDAVPQIFKDVHTVPSRKRTFEDEIKLETQSYEATDRLTSAQDSLFPPCVLPYTPNSSLGLTTPKPDWIYGIRTNKYPHPDHNIPDDVQPFVSLGTTNMDHIFFAIENKSCEGTIEEAENQALRTGAALVCGRRTLNKMAEDDPLATEPAAMLTPPPSTTAAAPAPPTDPAHPATAGTAGTEPTPPTRSTTTLLDSFATATHSTATSPNPVATSKPDHQSYYFTCAWVPTLARIFVHWYEDFGLGKQGIYHMTRMGEFHASNEDSVRRFRQMGHNIFDWGILVNQKACREVGGRIVKKRRIV